MSFTVRFGTTIHAYEVLQQKVIMGKLSSLHFPFDGTHIQTSFKQISLKNI